jgi:type IV secretion system protein VirD4
MTRAQILFCAIYLVAGTVAACCLAGWLYFVLSKAAPAATGVDTWLRYWDAYSTDGSQRKRLLFAMALALAAVFVIPVIALASRSRAGRSLHGDARWATRAEIRKAGLL